VCSSIFQVLLKSVQWFCRCGWSKIAFPHYFDHWLIQQLVLPYKPWCEWHAADYSNICLCVVGSVEAELDCKGAGLCWQQEGVCVRSIQNEGGAEWTLRDSDASHLSGELGTCVYLHWKAVAHLNCEVSSVLLCSIMITMITSLVLSHLSTDIQNLSSDHMAEYVDEQKKNKHTVFKIYWLWYKRYIHVQC